MTIQKADQMKVKLNENGRAVLEIESRTVTFNPIFSTLQLESRIQYLDKIKEIRPDIWILSIGSEKEHHNIAETTFQYLKKMFCEGRIDIKRAVICIQKGGDLNTLKIDEPIMTGEKSNIQAYTDEWKNRNFIFDSLTEKYGIESIDMDDRFELHIYHREEKNLKEKGILLPGILGI
jgi:hypothetical protein